MRLRMENKTTEHRLEEWQSYIEDLGAIGRVILKGNPKTTFDLSSLLGEVIQYRKSMGQYAEDNENTISSLDRSSNSDQNSGC